MRTVKTVLIWFLILVAAVAVYSLIERRQQSTRVLSLDELFTQLQQGAVAEVRVDGSNLQGRLSNDERFQATIPDGYPSIFERLTEAGVRVNILPADNRWFGSSWPTLPTALLVTGLILWIAISTVILVLVLDLSRLVKRHLARSNSNPSAA